MKRLCAVGLVMFALGSLTSPAVAQTVVRIVAVYGGQSKALLADSVGRLRVVCE